MLARMKEGDIDQYGDVVAFPECRLHRVACPDCDGTGDMAMHETKVRGPGFPPKAGYFGGPGRPDSCHVGT